MALLLLDCSCELGFEVCRVLVFLSALLFAFWGHQQVVAEMILMARLRRRRASEYGQPIRWQCSELWACKRP